MPETRLLLQEVVDVGVRLVEARYGALGVRDEMSGAFSDFLTAGLDAETRLAIGRNPAGLGLLGDLFRDPRPLRVPVIWQDPRAAGFPLGHPRMRSFLGVPLLSARKVRGGLYFSDKETAPEFRVEDERLAECLARLAASALDQKANHPEIRRALKFIRGAVDEHDEAVIIMGPGREILRWSEGAQALFGFNAGEALGRGFVDLLVPPEDHAQWRRQFEPRLMRDLAEGKVYRADVTRLHKDGRRIPVAINLYPIIQELAGIKAIMGVYKFRKL